jgi:hypothetical protein
MPIGHQLDKQTGAAPMTTTGSEIRLSDWVTPETWCSGNSMDEHRFYRFVSALWMEHRTPIESEELFARIADEVMERHPDIDRELLERNVDKYVGQAQAILGYNRAMIEDA